MKVRWGHVRLQPHRFVQFAQFQPDRAPQVDGHDFPGIDFERLVTVAERRLDFSQVFVGRGPRQIDVRRVRAAFDGRVAVLDGTWRIPQPLPCDAAQGVGLARLLFAGQNEVRVGRRAAVGRLEIRQPLLPGIQLQVDHPPAGQGGAFAFRTEGFSTIYQWRSLAASFWKYWIDVR